MADRASAPAASSSQTADRNLSPERLEPRAATPYASLCRLQERRHVERRNRLESAPGAPSASGSTADGISGSSSAGRRAIAIRGLPRRPRRPARPTPAARTCSTGRSTGVCAADGLQTLGGRRPVEAGGDDGDLDLPLHLRIDDRAEDDVGVLVRGFLDDRRRLAHLDQREVRPPVTLMMTPRAPLTDASSSSGLEIAALAAAIAPVRPSGDAGAHDRQAHARHDRLHVGEVEVDQPRHEDEVRDALDRLAQHVVGRGERLVERRVARRSSRAAARSGW